MKKMGFIFNVEEAYAKRDALNEQFTDAIVNEDVIALEKALKNILENETLLIQGVTMPINNYTAFITLTALREVCKSIESQLPDAAEEADDLQKHISTTTICMKMPKEGD
jgi:hypothetical protein